MLHFEQVSSHFKHCCLNLHVSLDSQPQPAAKCAFGKPFEFNKSKTFTPIKNENFNTFYGDGEFLIGTVGFDTITVAGLTAKNQTIGLVDSAAWLGDGTSSGLLGFAYPALTSVYSGSDPNSDSTSNLLEYDPFFYTAVKQGRSQPCQLPFEFQWDSLLIVLQIFPWL